MYTIKQNSFNEFIVKNSKFISLSFKVDSINEVTDILNSIKLEYEHATHYTYAYLIDGFCKYDDDNEPSKTSGFQILDLLEKRQLNHILCVVVRYFGGIKLGVGGLSRAYRKAANDVLLKSGIIELVEAYKVLLSFDYKNVKDIDYLLKNAKIIDKKFNDKVEYTFIISKNDIKKIEEYNPSILDNTFIEIN